MTTCNVPVLTTCGSYCFSYNAAMTFLKVNKYKLEVKCVDSYCFVIESKKTSKGINIYSGYNFKGFKEKIIIRNICFVAEKNGFTAHGNTVKKSIQDLNFKIISETLKKEPILKDTVITIEYYRIVTGACELGCKSFIQQHGLKESYKAKDLLPILEKKQAYGIDRFKSLINW